MSIAKLCLGKIVIFQKAQYIIYRPNNFLQNSVSLYNESTHKWLRHTYGKIIEQDLGSDENIELFATDSSFIPKLYMDGIIFQCANNGLHHLYISIHNNNAIIDVLNNAYQFELYHRPSIGEKVLIENKYYIICEPNNSKNGYFSFLKADYKLRKYFFWKHRETTFLRKRYSKIIESTKNNKDLNFNNETSFKILIDSGSYIVECFKENNKNSPEKTCYILKDNMGNLYAGERGHKALITFPSYNMFDGYEIILENQSAMQHEINNLHDLIKRQNDIIQNIISKNNEGAEMIYQYFRKQYISNDHRIICVSVIVPVYNMEWYLKDCIQSITCQSLKDIEIIVIDDGSTDNSYAMADKISRKDKRISLIRQNNKGVGFARNRGIQIAKGEYICFIDPDDIYPTDDILEKLYVYGKQFNMAIVGGEFSTFTNADNEVEQNFSQEYDGYLFNSTKIVRYSNYQYDYGFHRFLYSREMIIKNKIFFPNFKRFQDPPFMVHAMITAETFLGVDFISYAYRVSHKKIEWTDEKIKDLILGISNNIKIAKQMNYIKLQLYCFYHFVEHINQIDEKLSDATKNNIINLLDLFDKELINSKYRKNKIAEIFYLIQNKYNVHPHKTLGSDDCP